MSNTIQAIINLVTDPQLELGNYYKSRNRANSEGASLEEYVKDLYAGTLRETDEAARLVTISNTFSYLGNDSNPPDAVLKNGDAIEVKKIETNNGDIQLNSSHPKNKLSSNSTMITEECRSIDGGQWTKDILYIVGKVAEKKLQAMFMIYGEDYAATEQTYLNIKNAVKDSVTSIPGIESEETNEIGRFNAVDPLGITALRIRGMWILQNPWKAFSYITKFQRGKKFEFCAIINKKKCTSYPEWKTLKGLEGSIEGLSIEEVKIKNPNNPAKLINAELIRFTVK